MIIVGWIAKLVGPKAAKPVAILLFVLVLMGVGFALAKCTGGDDTAEQQAKQTSRSGDAIVNAADAAADTIDNRVVTETDIDRATENAIERIGNATNPDDVRNAVLDSVCSRASHRNDPACGVR